MTLGATCPAMGVHGEIEAFGVVKIGTALGGTICIALCVTANVTIGVTIDAAGAGRLLGL